MSCRLRFAVECTERGANSLVALKFITEVLCSPLLEQSRVVQGYRSHMRAEQFRDNTNRAGEGRIISWSTQGPIPLPHLGDHGTWGAFTVTYSTRSSLKARCIDLNNCLTREEG